MSDVGLKARKAFGERPGRAAVVAPDSSATLSKQSVHRLSITVLLGAVGFAPPAVGAVTRILDYWIESEQLWHLQRVIRAQPSALRPAIVEALGKVPAPPTLYRTALNERQLGGTRVPAGARVIIHLAAVYADAVRQHDLQPEAWFFGGPRSASPKPGVPRHGCPGREPGLIAIEEIIRALLEQKDLRRERRFHVSYRREPSKA